MAIDIAIILYYILLCHASQIYVETYLKCLGFLYACFSFLCCIIFSFPSCFSSTFCSPATDPLLLQAGVGQVKLRTTKEVNIQNLFTGWIQGKAPKVDSHKRYFTSRDFFSPEAEHRVLNENQILQAV